ncbi:TROVE domain-containing protein [bacterium]|nr:MAG: TROVE domain-containing protein [bacterium]
MKTKKKDESHLNWMEGKSYSIKNPIQALRMAASSCFFGEPMYYHRDKDDKRKVKNKPSFRLTDDQVVYLRDTLNAIDNQEWRALSPAEMMEKCIDNALDFDPELTLKEAVRLRNEEHIRTTPQIILVRAANHKSVKGTGLVRQYAKDIILRADEPSTGLAYQLWRFKKPIPNSLKKAWREAFERFDEYQIAKYRMESHEVKALDIMNLVHPKGEIFNKLAKGELKTTGKTWESIISEKGSNKKNWIEAIEVMGHMALLRNLRNLIEAEVNDRLFTKKLIKGAEKGKQLPFRYYSAYKAVKEIASPKVLDAVEECLTESLKNLPFFEGRVMSLCDNSGSARGATTSSMGKMIIANIANLTGIITGMQSDEGYIGIFGDKLEVIPVRRKSSIFDQLDKADKVGEGIGQGTENGIWLFWDKAIKDKEHWDYVFVYSDMQAGHGGLYGTNPNEYKDYQWNKTNNIDVPKLINQYRKMVNPDVMVYLVQVAGYQDTIVPEFYNKTFILGGWGEGLLKFADEMKNIDLQEN